MSEQQKSFYNVLFNEDEHTCFGTTTFDVKSSPVNDWTTLGGKHYQFFTINPLVKGRTRKGANVKTFRNLLFEIDNMPLKEQAEVIKKSGLPFSTCVFSGNKSFHYIISLREPLSDRVEYDAVWKACQEALLLHGATVDKATKDPSRLSRAGGGMREGSKEQKIMKVVDRVGFSELENWLNRNEIDWKDYLPRQDFRPQYVLNEFSNVDNKEKWDWVQKYYMKNDQYTDGNKHNYQVKMMYLLLRTGMKRSTIEALFLEKLGEVSTNLTWPNGMPEGGAIYVPTKQDRINYYKRLEEEQRGIQLQRRWGTPDGPETGSNETLVESIDRYIRVGTEYFKTNSQNQNSLLPWNKGTFQDDYGTGVLPPRCYDAFDYIPDYTSPEPLIEFGRNLEYRNYFQRPDWVVQPGDWSTIKGALKHGFGDQLPIILKFCAVSILWPKQPLPIIIFQGEEEVGKSATVKILVYLLGERNCKSINAKMFESPYDGYLMNTQLLIIEEAGQWVDGRAVADEFKRLVTEVGKIEINPKYGRVTEYNWFGKIVCTSNDLSPLLLEGSASRFWVRELKKIENPVSDYYNKIKAEMGHFVHYLINEVGPTLKNPDEVKPRLYFDPEEYWTPAKEFMKDFAKPQAYFKILELIEDFFNETDEDELYFDLKVLKQRGVGADVSDKQIKAILAREFGIKDKTKNLERADGLNYMRDPFGATSIPTRKTQWYYLKRSQLPGELVT